MIAHCAIQRLVASCAFAIKKQLVELMCGVGLDESNASTWTTLIVDDLRRFGFQQFQLLPVDYVAGNMGLIEYEFGSNAYSIDNAKPTAAPNFLPSDHGGTQLNRENLLLLARVSEIARLFWR